MAGWKVGGLLQSSVHCTVDNAEVQLRGDEQVNSTVHSNNEVMHKIQLVTKVIEDDHSLENQLGTNEVVVQLLERECRKCQAQVSNWKDSKVQSAM